MVTETDLFATSPLSINPFFMIGLWLVFVSFSLAIALALRDGIQQLRRLHQVPCTRCAFYTGDYHLKCTVNPCQALSEEAIYCLDYEKVDAQPRDSMIRVMFGHCITVLKRLKINYIGGELRKKFPKLNKELSSSEISPFIVYSQELGDR